jgi:hypothetical protein
LNSIRKQLSLGVTPDKLQYPDGRNPAQRRPLEGVVEDIRQATYAVLRVRPTESGIADVFALGSGFFVSKTAFLTCHHVVNDKRNPHRDGDGYRLVNNLVFSEHLMAGRVIEAPNAQTGVDVNFFPESDCAILVTKANVPQRFVALSYEEVEPGKEIGVAGYPLPELRVVEHEGQRLLVYNGLIYRVAKGVATAVYVTDLNTPATGPLAKVPVIEVNFLFVPGNSGGPIFDAENGRVIGFVQSFRAPTVNRQLVSGPFPDLGAEATTSYVETSHAIYSLGFRISRVRKIIESFGASL